VCLGGFVVDRFLVDVDHLLVAVLEATDAAGNGQKAVGGAVDRQSLARLQSPPGECLLNNLDDLTFGRFHERVVVFEIREDDPHAPAAHATNDT